MLILGGWKGSVEKRAMYGATRSLTRVGRGLRIGKAGMYMYLNVCNTEGEGVRGKEWKN